MEQVASLDGATPVVTGDGEFGFVWKKQAKFFKAAMRQLRSKVSFCAYSVPFLARAVRFGVE